MKKVVVIGLLASSLLCANGLKVLDISMGDKKGTLKVNELNCKNKCCETYIYKKDHHYNKINNDGNVNKVEVCYDHNDEVYIIELVSRLTADVRLIKNWKSVFDGLKKEKETKGINVEIGFYEAYGSKEVYINFVDLKRKTNFEANQKKNNNKALNDLNNF
ncbi:MAG: hypothetical protein AB7U24_02195 [Sulfurimonadaceae bacterium]